MLDIFLIPVLVIYVAVVLALFVYGINLFYLTYLSSRQEKKTSQAPTLKSFPKVTIQLPVYNEMYVAQRLIEKAAAVNYPRKLLEIQVLDDSVDETITLIHSVVADLQAVGVNVHHIHRTHRTGFKSGALAAGLEKAQGDFIAIFDADFLPPSDFLLKTLPHFTDPRVGFVQTRWGHTNPSYSLLTLMQALSIDAHFMVEQFARSEAGYWFNFNGSAGVWRRKTIEDAGGWSSDTLSEDLDLSYRAYLSGWKGVYLRDTVSPAELPVSMSAFRRQQHRWARGSLECAIKYLPNIWRTSLPKSLKFEATAHLLGYAVHLLLVALVLLHPLVLLFTLRYDGLKSLFGIGIVFNLAVFAQYSFILTAQRHLGKQWWRFIPPLIFFAAGGTGMMLNTFRAAVGIFTNKRAVFERTPKFGITGSKQNWTHQRYQLSLDPIVFLEICFAILNAGTCIFAFSTANWIIASYSLLFCVGLLLVASITIVQALSVAYQKSRKNHGLSSYLNPGMD